MAHQIEEHDHMFSTKVTPWHGLGTVLGDAPSIDEGLIAAKLKWSVDCERLYTHTGEMVTHRAVRRLDTKQILGVVGPQWTPLQNEEAFGVFRPLVERGDLLLETAGSLQNGRRVWILARMNIQDTEVAPGDVIKPYVLLSNAHDGSSGVRFGFTPIRVVCNNTLTTAHNRKESKLVKIVHSRFVAENLNELASVMDLSRETFNLTIEHYKRLVSRKCDAKTLKKYVQAVFDLKAQDAAPEDAYVNEAMKALNLDIPVDDGGSKVVTKVMELFESGRGSHLVGVRGTMWAAYNAVNEYLLYYRGSDDEKRLSRMWFGDGKSTDQRALEVALRMAA